MVSERPHETGDRFVAGIKPGSRVAGYLLEEQVGMGGMAVVFRAVDEQLGRRVALKFLAPALAADEAFRQRFMHESKAAAFVDDPHIIPVHAAGEAGGVLFIAMRWVPGGDVRTLMDAVGPLSPEQAGAIVSQVASALDAAHAAGLVHRDVKPANMLLDRRQDRPDHVYLSDFGLSKGMLTRSSPALTKFGEYLGTPLYTAPEQIRGRKLDGRADQYALACTAFEMLAGKPPFQRDHPEAVLWAQLHDPAPQLTSRRPDLPSAVDHVLKTALAKSPDDRYDTCRLFADSFQAALELPAYHAAAVATPAGPERATMVASRIGPPPAGAADGERTVTTAPPNSPGRPVVSERAIPSELASALASPEDEMRLGAVEGLRELAEGSQPDLAQIALQILNTLVSDRSKIVSAAASAALAKIVWGWPVPDQRPAPIVPPTVANANTGDRSKPWWEQKSKRWWER